MSARRTDILEIVSRYATGYFPLYDDEGQFYWERLPVRAIIPVNEQTTARAKRLARRGRKRFAIRRTTAVDDVIEQLRSENVKANSWVRDEVIAIYRALHKAGMLRTIEAWAVDSGKLVGALLGISFPGTFVAETMYGIVPEASKICGLPRHHRHTSSASFFGGLRTVPREKALHSSLSPKRSALLRNYQSFFQDFTGGWRLFRA